MTIAALSCYLSQDRRRALASGESLSDRATGAALFADISGFTPLTERLRETLGHRRGAEELTHYLDTIYGTLISVVERYQGSVVGFAGDAMLCWFDEAEGMASARAVACALALQQAMQPFSALTLPDGAITALALKVAVITGAVRRFVVGDPEIYRMDALAGETIARTATAEHLAQKGEVLVDSATVAALGESLQVSAWRVDNETSERFAVAEKLEFELGVRSLSFSSTLTLNSNSNLLRPWLHRAVYERELSGQGSFLTEFRPTVVLFIRFIGIDYDSDEGESQLDQFVRQIQAIVTRYEGTFLQITIGDKGSYALISFGALTTHEDDVRRATRTALDIRHMATQLSYLQPLQMGLTQGVTWVGGYGGTTRRAYSVMGDEVNVAARLMQAAAPGEILLSGRAQKLVANLFSFEPRPPIALKGKVEPLAAFAVAGARQVRAIRLQEPSYALPMVGRKKELEMISEKLEMALAGKSQIIGIVAEAGLGKSRLVAEVIRLAHKKGFTGYGGACQSDAINTPYLAWKPIWSAFFDVDPAAPLRKQMRLLEGEIDERAPERVQAIPLLNVVLDLAMPENDFTQTLDPQTRKSALHALLEDCLKATARETPILLVIEDMHWIDGLSHDLLEELVRAMTTYSLCIVLAYRPPQLLRLMRSPLETLPNFSKIELSELSQAECEQAIRAKLAQLYPSRQGSIPPLLVEKLMARAQGNPFYLEELLNYLHDRGLDPRDPTALAQIELPDTLHALILSRLDNLTERAKITLRVACIIGRLFRAAWLTGYYPALGDPLEVRGDLHELHVLDITPMDSPEPELTYLFKHIITHEVTYESLPFATRAQLHEQLAAYLEGQLTPENSGALLDTIAHHYGQSHNIAKQRDYFQKAGAAAKGRYANDAALGYYDRLLPLLSDPHEQMELHLQWGEVLELIGNTTEAESHYHKALTFATPDVGDMARCQLAMGKLYSSRYDYNIALSWLDLARSAWTELNNQIGLGQSLGAIGSVFLIKGQYIMAQQYFEESLLLAQKMKDKESMAHASHGLGSIAWNQGNYTLARTWLKKSLLLFQELGNKMGIGSSLTSLAYVVLRQGDYLTTISLHKESMALFTKIGNKQGIAVSLNNMGGIAFAQGDYQKSRSLYEESLKLNREIDNKRGIASSLLRLGLVALSLDNYIEAQTLYEEALVIYRKIDTKRDISTALYYLGVVAWRQGNSITAKRWYNESLILAREIGQKNIIAESLNGLGFVALSQGHYFVARSLYKESLLILFEMGHKTGIVYTLLGMTQAFYQEGANERTTHLLAYVETLRTGMQIQLYPLERRLYDETLTATRVALGEEAFQAAWAQGQAMTLDEAVALALAS